MPGLIRGEAFTELFRTFEHTAWRLEVRRAYGKQSDESFPRWLAGENPELSWFRPWLELMSALTGEGKRVERVRVVDEPPSDYMRYEVWLNPHNKAAGEDIRYLNRSMGTQLDLPSVDYWLFDSRRAAKLHYADDDDRFLGAEIIDDPAVVIQHTYCRDAAWHHAETFDRYAKRIGIGVAVPG